MQQDWAVSVYFISSCTKRGCFTDPKCSTELDQRQNVEGMTCVSTVVPWVDNLFLGDICFPPTSFSSLNEIQQKEEKAALITKHKYIILTGFKMCLCYYAVKFDVYSNKVASK